MRMWLFVSLCLCCLFLIPIVITICRYVVEYLCNCGAHSCVYVYVTFRSLEAERSLACLLK